MNDFETDPRRKETLLRTISNLTRLINEPKNGDDLKAKANDYRQELEQHLARLPRA